MKKRDVFHNRNFTLLNRSLLKGIFKSFVWIDFDQVYIFRFSHVNSATDFINWHAEHISISNKREGKRKSHLKAQEEYVRLCFMQSSQRE